MGHGEDSKNSKSNIDQKGKQIEDPFSLNDFTVANSEVAVITSKSERMEE